ncbi:MAG: transcriptional regulator LytR [Candidatus Parcubacteria bacterium]|jgi:hypothetical protein
MLKAAPKKKAEKAEKKPRKNTGRPIRAVAEAARAAARTQEQKSVEVEIKETETVVTAPEQPQEENISTSPRHVVVEVGDGAASDATPQQEAITTQNLAEAITTENPAEYATVRKNVSSSRLFVVALGTGILLGLLVFGGLILYESYGGKIGSMTGSLMSPSPTPTKTPPPTPTQAVLNPAEYQIQILNGSGVSGAAGDVETLLNDAGFTQTSTGNASEYGFTDTEIAMKSDVPKALFGKLKSTLTGYSVVDVTALPSDGEYDVVITVGTTSDE